MSPRRPSTPWQSCSKPPRATSNSFFRTGPLSLPKTPSALPVSDLRRPSEQPSKRRPGGYRQPTTKQRELSRLTKDEFSAWFQQFWRITGASTKKHPAPFPIELAYRLVRMFSFIGDTVLDPFLGTGTTCIAAMRCQRNSLGIEIDEHYLADARHRMELEASNLFSSAVVQSEEVLQGDLKAPQNLVRERVG